MQSSLNGTASNHPDSTVSSSFSAQSGAGSPVFHHSERMNSLLLKGDIPLDEWLLCMEPLRNCVRKAALTCSMNYVRVPLEPLNCSPTRSAWGKTPQEAWSGRKPGISQLRVFGSIAYAQMPDQKLSKLDDRSKKYVFIGYDSRSKGYKLYNPSNGKLGRKRRATDTTSKSRRSIMEESSSERPHRMRNLQELYEFSSREKIQDNILVSPEAFHFHKRKRRDKQSSAAIKLDLSKAYDCVKWDFLEAVMHKMGFCDMWIHWDAKRVICNLLNVPLMGADSKYLGLPLFWGGPNQKLTGSSLIEKAITKMQGWKTEELNAVGKETLIKHIIQAIPTDAMSCFAFSQKFCKTLNKSLRRFWWSGSLEGCKNSLVVDFINPTMGEWRIAKLRQVLSEEEVQAVANISISKLGGAYAIVWGLHSSGKYRVKRAYPKAWTDYIDSKPEHPSTSIVP
ncbi:hypothetical protein RHSIM_Rhsim02G0101300 [Rhododendron simsii]|uniref:Retroviral polymerase SH3-like domain-containing protein n=1 Tax=Rhododendron simsii TaxID=118357 RepID=A0A834LW58_RHOSS|nr:hypothetical protein RHSIM_Rhsim02G0101300 [Rhododendron simsii]